LFSIGLYFFAASLSVFQANVQTPSVFYVWQLARVFFFYTVVTKACAADERVVPALLKGIAFGMFLAAGQAIHLVRRKVQPASVADTLADERDDLANKIREVFVLDRIVRIDGQSGGYVHHNGASGVIMEVEGGTAEVVKDIAMHTAAMRPQAVSKEELDPAVVANANIKAAYPNFKITKDPSGRATYGCSSGGAEAMTSKSM
jgi:hypothetical protein